MYHIKCNLIPKTNSQCHYRNKYNHFDSKFLNFFDCFRQRFLYSRVASFIYSQISLFTVSMTHSISDDAEEFQGFSFEPEVEPEVNFPCCSCGEYDLDLARFR